MIESLASIYSVDIARIEARHSSNREITMLCSRGWFVNLATRCTTFVSWTVSRLWRSCADVCSAAPEKPSREKAGPAKRRAGKEHCQKKRRGGGGALRAFIHHRFQDLPSGQRKFTVSMMSELADEYRVLPPDQKQMFQRAGLAAAAAHRQGFRSFSKLPRSEPSSQRPHLGLADSQQEDAGQRPGDVTESGAIVATSAEMEVVNSLRYRGEGRFQQDFQEISEQVRADKHPDQDELSQEEQLALRALQATCHSEPLVAGMDENQHTELSRGFVRRKSCTLGLIPFHWFPPVQSVVQAQGP